MRNSNWPGYGVQISTILIVLVVPMMLGSNF